MEKALFSLWQAHCTTRRMRTLHHDLQYALRIAWRRPTLTIVTVLTLALGIGGNSAIFSLVNGLFLRPLPVDRPEQLVRVFGQQDGRPFDVSSYLNLSDLAARSKALAATAIHQQTTSAYGLGDATETANVELVSGNYFSMLGIRPPLGRSLTSDDDVNGNPQAVAVVSDAWWKSRLGARLNVLGETVHLNGAPFTVVGVAPRTFRGSYDALSTDLWVTLMTYDIVRPRGLQITRRGWGWLSATARLAPGVTVAQAQADVDRVTEGLRTEFRGNTTLEFNLVHASALPEEMGPTVQRVLFFALLVAGLALAAACANVANAQLATVLDRQREIAIRLAMGASRARVVRQWLSESLLLAAIAAAVGTLGAMWLQDAATAIGPVSGLENFSPFSGVDARLVAFSAVMIGTVTVLFGGLPALRAARVDVAGPLKDDSTASTGTHRKLWAQAMLVTTQVAVSVALLVSGALLGRSLAASRAFDVGFNTRNLVIATPNMANLGLDATRGRLYYSDTAARVRALPGVTGVALAAVVPLGGGDESLGITIDGYTRPEGDGPISTSTNYVSPNYFEVMGIPIRRGRNFVASDGEEKAPVVAVVSEAMAKRYWPDGNPIGRTMRVSNVTGSVEVVGVAADITYRAPGEAPRPRMYLPFGPVYFQYGLSFHVRTAGADPTLARALRRELRVADPRVQVAAMPYEELRQQALYPGRALAVVSSGFGAIVLLLAVAGIYGVMAHVVASRHREFAVRLALGARPQTLVASVIGRGLRWSVAGVISGVVMAASLAQLLKTFLFGVSTTDAMSFGGTALVLLAISLLAAYAAARRLLKLDPAQMLRR
ncbi:MAG: ADOP family duplicated permease [Vicinamibacterales bacterium]